MEFTGKLIIDSKLASDNSEIIVFSSYLKKNFLDRQLKIILNNFSIDRLEFYSNRYGICKWNLKNKIYESNSWETESQVQDSSPLLKHYPSMSLNSETSSSYALGKIIPNVLEQILNPDLKDLIEKALVSDTRLSLDPSIIDSYEKLEKAYLETKGYSK
ncbi:hypothetical protein [Leptospira sp. GIMC2001]|uniref:hypothetical protein n=1 Tax=Leptospira sp. GIMC2001 TaxID=1513297 RepID=UPI00234BD36A|nr:hypothetical protein [Leptospira sp. GIMC2001]WCL49222.1 hypothetical protein O4O04_18300 [Leptospira sp. GIMC2001]